MHPGVSPGASLRTRRRALCLPSTSNIPRTLVEGKLLCNPAQFSLITAKITDGSSLNSVFPRQRTSSLRTPRVTYSSARAGDYLALLGIDHLQSQRRSHPHMLSMSPAANVDWKKQPVKAKVVQGRQRSGPASALTSALATSSRTERAATSTDACAWG